MAGCVFFSPGNRSKYPIKSNKPPEPCHLPQLVNIMQDWGNRKTLEFLKLIHEQKKKTAF